MKALSIRQPFAELILNGKKKIETRTWNTKFRGEFYIHASQGIYKDKMKKFGFKDLPKGYLVGKATLVDTIKYPDNKTFLADYKNHCVEGPLGNWENKTKYGFILKNVKRLKKPIPYKGSLNFFEVNL